MYVMSMCGDQEVMGSTPTFHRGIAYVYDKYENMPHHLGPGCMIFLAIPNVIVYQSLKDSDVYILRRFSNIIGCTQLLQVIPYSPSWFVLIVRVFSSSNVLTFVESSE